SRSVARTNRPGAIMGSLGTRKTREARDAILLVSIAYSNSEEAMRSAFPLAIIVACVDLASPAKADPVVQALAAATGVVVLAEILWPSANADQRDFVSFEGGRFDAIKKDDAATEFELQYNFGTPVLWKIAPIVGIGATTDRSFWGYGGIRL